jgi:hypothetical protein
MAATMRIVLCGPEGEELFSGYSVSTIPPPVGPKAAYAADDEETEREGPSSSGLYLAAPPSVKP